MNAHDKKILDELAKEYNVEHDEMYIDACHFAIFYVYL